MTLQEAVKEIEKTIAHQVLMSVWREAGCNDKNTSELRRLLEAVADEYDTNVEILDAIDEHWNGEIGW